MLIYPAIDIFSGKAVRLYKGDYAQMTVYSEHPEEIAADFTAAGATRLHMVDLEGAKSGEPPNLETVKRIVESTGLFSELGGGIRSMDTIARYLDIGVKRVILGTAAVTEKGFVEQAVAKYGEAVAVGVDIRDNMVAIKGWTEKSSLDAFEFCRRMQDCGVKTIISTDISKDGAMQGANHALYERLSSELKLDIIASGGVSSLDDITRLKKLGIHGAIIGKAYYSGAVNLRQAIEAAK